MVQLRRRMVVALPATLLISFTLFIFGPLEIYLTNINELWFKLTGILPSIIMQFMVSILLLLILSLILPAKIFKYIQAIILGLGISFYLQGNFLNRNFGVLNGQIIIWSNYTLWAAFEAITWISVIIALILLAKYAYPKFKSISKFVCFLIISVQVVTLVSVAFTMKNKSTEPIILTDSGISELSSEKNLIVLMLDTFDATVLNEVLADEPDILNKFEGFTYYQNTLGYYPTTKGALPHILTGEVYENEQTYNDYVKAAYEKTNIYDVLSEEGFNIALYTESMFVSQGEDKVSNLVKSEKKVTNQFQLGSHLNKFTLFRYVPTFIKPAFWMSTDEFDQYIETSNLDGQSVYTVDDVQLYEKTKNLSFNQKEKSYKFYQLRGIHPPYIYDEHIKSTDSSGITERQVVKANLRIVESFIDQLKDAKMYDDTAIIVLADHGYKNMSQHPILLVKDYNSNSKFQSSLAPISYEDLKNTILFMVTRDVSYTPNVFTWKENDPRTRRFLFYNWGGADGGWNKAYLPTMIEYNCIGSSALIENFYKTYRTYTTKGMVMERPYTYTVGEKIDFSDSGNAKQIFSYGLSLPEGSSTWSLGKKAEAVLTIKDYDKYKNLEMQMEFDYILPGLNKFQRMNIYVGDTKIAEKQFALNELSCTFTIPTECIKETMSVSFEFPDAISPNSLGMSADTRELAFSFKSIILAEDI